MIVSLRDTTEHETKIYSNYSFCSKMTLLPACLDIYNLKLVIQS